MTGESGENRAEVKAYTSAASASSTTAHDSIASNQLIATAMIDQFEAYLAEFQGKVPDAVFARCALRVNNARTELGTSVRDAELELTYALRLLCAALGIAPPV